MSEGQEYKQTYLVEGGEPIPAKETALQRKIREHQAMTDSLVTKIETKRDDSKADLEAKREKEKSASRVVSETGNTRIVGSVSPEDMRPSAYTRPAEEVIANEGAGAEGERYERRKDEEVGK